VLEAKQKKLVPAVEALGKLLDQNDVLRFLIEDACHQNRILYDTQQHNPVNNPDSVSIPRITDKDAILRIFNVLLNYPPSFVNNDLVGLPFSAFVVGIDPTLSGAALLRLPMFNEKMSAILQVWNKFLDTPASNVGFRVEGQQWLSPTAKKLYDFPLWKKDSEVLPYWRSWNSFFTRVFKDPASARPIADPTSNRTVISANDGSLYRWRPHLKREDVFWFKDMPYSLSDILSSPIKAQQDVIDKYNLVEMFKGGYIFQTYLNPYNFHRWWCPVNGKVLFDAMSIPGCYFSKLVIPDFGGATTASTPYLAQVNARGLVVFKTPDYGHVCCIPLGMSEVSTISFDPAMKEGAMVKKGQEMGTFNYGGSSFAVLYEKLPKKVLVFTDAKGNLYPQDPPPAASSSGTGNYPTNIGAQIGLWADL
jgi:phosphatidylserine decarboxylase